MSGKPKNNKIFQHGRSNSKFLNKEFDEMWRTPCEYEATMSTLSKKTKFLHNICDEYLEETFNETISVVAGLYYLVHKNFEICQLWSLGEHILM